MIVINFIVAIVKKMKQKKTDDDLTKLKRTGYDYYKILGVDKNSDMSVIKKKYRHLLAKYHPDKLNLRLFYDEFLFFLD